jgi:predicted secreted hydrolase
MRPRWQIPHRASCGTDGSRRATGLLSVVLRAGYVAVACFLLCLPAMAAAPGFEFAKVTPGHPPVFPADAGAHPAFRTEWWYATGWLDMPDGKPLGFQITFFRSSTGLDPANPSAFAPSQLIIAHAALSDPAIGKLVHGQRIAREGFGLAYAKAGTTDVKLDAWRMLRAADGRYTVAVDAGDFVLDLSLTPTQPPLLQGENGYSRKGPLPSQASYYYSEPQLRVSGNVTRPDRQGGHAAASTPVKGVAWLDHEWSSTLLSPDATGWDWLGANLSDGSALMAFKVRGRNGGAVWAHAALRNSSGHVTVFDAAQVDFVPVRTWRSPHTGTSYPVSMSVRAGSNDWQLDPLIDDQELDSRDSTGAVYWEGAVIVRRAGKVAGRGYLELTGYDGSLRLDRH